MDGEESKLIRITHYINPHLFWFKYVDSSTERREQNIDSNLKAFIAKTYKKTCAPALHLEQIVATYWVAKNKWIRAVVDQDDPSDGFVILWAIDYGFPMRSATELVIPLDSNYGSAESVIVQGGLYDVIPSRTKLNVSQTILCI